ncbi:MAG: DinB family protein [Bacteroidota bacterium]
MIVFKRKQLLIGSIIALLCCTTSSLSAQQNDFVRDFVERLENSRKYLIQVAKIMPEENYHFKATPDSLTFAENLMHIGFAMDWHCQSLLGGRTSRDWHTDTVYKVGNRSKEELIRIIDRTFDETIAFMKSFDAAHLKGELDYFGLNRTKRQIFMLLADHITHHRGQMLVYLRLNGRVPPRYVLFQ